MLSRGTGVSSYKRTMRTFPRSFRVYLSNASAAQQLRPLRLPNEHQSLLPLVFSSNNLQISGRDDGSVTRLLPAETIQVSSRTKLDTLELTEQMIPFFLASPTSHLDKPIGFLRPDVVLALESDHVSQIGNNGLSCWNLSCRGVTEGVPSVSFRRGTDRADRTAQMARVVKKWRNKGSFKEILRGWSDEAYPIYHFPETKETSDDPIAFSIERAALPLFGFPNFGSLLIAYFQCPSTGRTMLWIPRRSPRKRTWPGKLDVTVGGGIGLGETPMSTILRECTEEASLNSDFVKRYISPVGILPFRNRSPAGWILPGLYYLFDLPLPPDGSVRPEINAADGEVDYFELMDVQTVLENLLEENFKSSSAMAILDWLIRHGFIGEESDPRFVDVCLEMRRPISLPVPWRSI